MVSIQYPFVLNEYIVFYVKYDQILHFCILLYTISVVILHP